MGNVRVRYSECSISQVAIETKECCSLIKIPASDNSRAEEGLLNVEATDRGSSQWWGTSSVVYKEIPARDNLGC